ncbi:manganese and iron superoxide dismutase [Ganoderma leucocontextum]|nr:manganese and iron superoxide dismutase [Ganoderma leucocontextum]
MSMLTTLARSAARAARVPTASLSLAARSVHTVPPLDYPYDALEPYISGQIMELHHSKHHQAYVNGLNAAEDAYAKAVSPKDRIRLQPALKFNGGGHINHTLFWKNLAPHGKGGGELPAGPLKQKIEADFGSVEAFEKQMNTTTAGIQGSGWGWLAYNPVTKTLEIVTTANQDPLLTHVPIIGIDIWEHAFYLQYYNVKADYLAAIWNVINFKEAERRLAEATK